MRFKITNTDAECLKNYESIFQEFNCQVKADEIYSQYGDYKEYTIEINNLEDLKLLQEKVDWSLIITFGKEENEIEIYDGWRE